MLLGTSLSNELFKQENQNKPLKIEKKKHKNRKKKKNWFGKMKKKIKESNYRANGVMKKDPKNGNKLIQALFLGTLFYINKNNNNIKYKKNSLIQKNS